jgi:hypothetical protein
MRCFSTTSLLGFLLLVVVLLQDATTTTRVRSVVSAAVVSEDDEVWLLINESKGSVDVFLYFSRFSLILDCSYVVVSITIRMLILSLRPRNSKRMDETT